MTKPRTGGAADSALSIADFVGDRRPIGEIARALGQTERALRNFLAKNDVPFVKALGTRYVDPAHVRTAIEQTGSVAHD